MISGHKNSVTIVLNGENRAFRDRPTTAILPAIGHTTSLLHLGDAYEPILQLTTALSIYTTTISSICI